MEKSLTRLKDPDLLILSNLDDRSLISFCLTSQYANKLCSDENFWRNRLVKKWGEDVLRFTGEIKGTKKRTYKNFYLSLLRYEDKYNLKEKWNLIAPIAIQNGDLGVGLFMLYYGPTHNDYNWGLHAAAKSGNMDLVKFFISKGANNYGYAMLGAVESGQKDIVDYLIDKGIDYRFYGNYIKTAEQHNNKELVNFFLNKIPEMELLPYVKSGLVGAAQGGNKELVDFFIFKGANNWNDALEAAAEGGHKDLVTFFIDKGANEWWLALFRAEENGHYDLADYIRSEMEKRGLDPNNDPDFPE